MPGFPLTGVDPNDPLPANHIEIRFGQGQGTGGGTSRDVLFLGNKTSAGSETTNTLNEAIADAQDCIDRFGQRSQIYQMYRTYVKTDPNATIYAIAVPEAGGTSATRDLVIATTATGATTLIIGCVGEEVEVPIESGQLSTAIATNVNTYVGNQLDWPVTVSVVASTVTFTAANKGPQGDYVLNTLYAKFRKSVATTATFGAVTGGTTEDDYTTALGLLDGRHFYYQVNPKTSTTTVSATDNGLGEHAAFITAQALPSVGNRQQMIAALVGTNAQGITTAASFNNARVFLMWSENCLLPPPMLAAKFAAVKRSKEIVQPAANLTDYGLGQNDIFNVPPPFSAGDRPTLPEQRAALNNGFTPVGFTATGTSYIIRHVTSRSLLGSLSDFRTRPGHIISALDYSAIFINDRVDSVAQPWVADDQPEGAPPVGFVTTPVQVKSEIATAIGLLINTDSGPILDPSPSVVTRMIASVQTKRLINGTSSMVELQAAKHNDKTDILILETSPGV